MNKNQLKFSGKKYADEIWLYTFAKDEKSGIVTLNQIIELTQREISIIDNPFN